MKFNCSLLGKTVLTCASFPAEKLLWVGVESDAWVGVESDAWVAVLIPLVSGFVSRGSMKHLTLTSNNRFWRSKECFRCTEFISALSVIRVESTSRPWESWKSLEKLSFHFRIIALAFSFTCSSKSEGDFFQDEFDFVLVDKRRLADDRS